MIHIRLYVRNSVAVIKGKEKMFRRLAIGDMLYVALPGNEAAVVLQYFVNHNWCDIILLVIPYPHVDAGSFEQVGNLLNGSIGVMIREEYLGLDELGGAGCLFRCHGERLVGGEKCHVDVFDVPHLWNILGITGDIYTETVKSQYEPVVTSFGMIFLFAWSGVVRRYGIHLDIISQLQMITIVHDLALAYDLGAVRIRNDYGRWLFQLSDGHRVTVIKVLMCYEDVVSFGIGTVIRRRLQAANRVHFYLPTVKRDADAAMFDGGKDNLLAAPGLERVCLGSSVLL